MIDLLNEILQTIRNNKVRTILTGIAVTWGVFMLIVLLGMARGLTNTFDENLMDNQSSRLKIWGGNTSIPWRGNPEGRRIIMKERDIKTLPASNPGEVDKVTAIIYGGSTLQTPKARIKQTYSGVYPDYRKDLSNVYLSEGRFINARDMDEMAKVIVIPQYYAEQLFPSDGKGAYGGRVMLNDLSFRVVGIYESRWRRDVYIPFTTACAMQTDRSDLGNLTVELKNVATEQEALDAERNVRETLSKIHGFDPSDESAVYISNLMTGFFKILQANSVLNISVWVLGILTMLTGVVGISNIMFVSVRERTHEIGIRRAIGAKPSWILVQILAEAVAITLIFGYIGIVAGTAVTQVVAYMMGDDGPLINPTVSLSIAFEVTAVLVFAGAVAGLFPALKALKVKPVEALRDE